MSGMINGLTTVNGGKIIETPICSAEVIGPGYSNHLTNCVVLYAKEGNIKISLVYYGSNCVVYRFKHFDSTQHYWSRAYDSNYLKSTKKYGKMVEAAEIIYKSLGFCK